MTHVKTVASIILFCSALLPLSAALTEAAASSPAPLWGYLSPPPPFETSADVRAFSHLTCSIRQAIEAADRTQSGKVIEIGLVKHGHEKLYHVIMGGPAGLYYLAVDPVAGAVRGAGRPDVTRAELDPEGLRDLATLESARFSLLAAVISAERLTGGAAIAAGVEQLGGIAQYYVQTVEKQKLIDVIVNPQTGRAARPAR
jgi:uncharacterized membrane protein YkoI